VAFQNSLKLAAVAARFERRRLIVGDTAVSTVGDAATNLGDGEDADEGGTAKGGIETGPGCEEDSDDVVVAIVVDVERAVVRGEEELRDEGQEPRIDADIDGDEDGDEEEKDEMEEKELDV